MFDGIILTTGVLRRNIHTAAAHVEVANFSLAKVREATVQFYDWNTTPPTLIASYPLSLPPSSKTSLDVYVAPYDHYEVRVIMGDKEHADDVIVNCFGRDASYALQAGNTVLFKELVKLEPKHHHHVDP